jgi:hypothetical protein
MKFSITATLLILALGGAWGLVNHRQSSAQLVQKQGLDVQARQLGISTGDRITGRRSREMPQNQARSSATYLIAFAAELERHEKAGGKPDPAFDQRTREMEARLIALDPAELQLFIATLRADKSLTAQTRGSLISLAILLLADEHPATALGLFSESSDLLADSVMSQQAVHSALRSWAKQDLGAALAWVKKNAADHPDAAIDELAQSIITSVAEADPKLGFKLITENPLEDPSAAIQALVENCKNPEQRSAVLAALRDHLATLPAGEERDGLLQESLENMGRGLTDESFATASSWLAAAKFNPTEASQFAAGLSYFNTKEDTGQWLDWMARTLPKDSLAENIDNLVGQWTQQDYQAAGKWLTASPAGEAKNAAVSTYAGTVAEYEPETAVAWALTLPSGPQRQLTLETIYRNWPPKDTAGATVFAEKYGIDPSIQP